MPDWRRIKSVFEEVIDLPDEDRASALAALCAGDDELRAGVERLLASHDAAGDFLLAPTLNGSAEVAAIIGAEGRRRLPDRIGAYTPIEIVGEGGFGVVYKAQQETPVRRTVALKVIRQGMDTRDVISRFESERQALAMMSHPNIAAVLDAGATSEGRPYFVMEFVPGDPMTTYCDRWGLSLKRRLELFVQVCNAVQHAHQKGIIHRDIKPSNVLVLGAGNGESLAKVIDFGVAKATRQRLTEDSIATLDGILVGTPEYMSPEQAEPGERDIDTRTDVYSLGVLLYELLTGTLPLGRRTLRRKPIGEIQRIVREVDPPRPSQRLTAIARQAAPNPNGATDTDEEATIEEISRRRGADPRNLIRRVRGELDWIVMKCMEKDRGRRYDSAAAIAAEIERYLRNEPVLAGPPSPMYRLAKFTSRHRIMMTAIVVVVVGMIVGMSIAVAGLREANRARDVAERQKRNAEESEKEARLAMRKAEAVNKFLQKMLGEADPRRSARRDMKVREALDDAVARLDAGEMSNEPEIDAEIRITIGRSYAGLAEFDAAQAQLTKAATAFRELHGPESEGLARALHERGAALKLEGRPAEAESDLRAALAIQEGRGTDGAAEAVSCANDLALALIDQRRFDEAAPLLDRVYQDATAPDSSEADLLPEAVNNLGSLYMAQGAFAKAAPYFREAIEVNTKRHGASHPDIATNYDNLAQALHGMNDLDASLEAYEKAIAMRRALLGDDHPDLATSLHNIAVLRYVRQELPECEAALRESLAIFKRIYGLAHNDTLTVNDSLVSVLGGSGRLDQAEPLLLESFEAVRAVPGIPQTRKRALAVRLSQLYSAMGKPEKAAEWTTTAESLASAPAPAAKAPSTQPTAADAGAENP
ncbi:MAG TPA: tetratricopeptide repeat protein [Phycisphaerae bacterium]|nr:tetratricopeptide repeat protein [Phycisphaerae bacterium]HRW53395.1 tetratricopeptide repeat protein [Phycisphaerae bacterium]